MNSYFSCRLRSSSASAADDNSLVGAVYTSPSRIISASLGRPAIRLMKFVVPSAGSLNTITSHSAGSSIAPPISNGHFNTKIRSPFSALCCSSLMGRPLLAWLQLGQIATAVDRTSVTCRLSSRSRTPYANSVPQSAHRIVPCAPYSVGAIDPVGITNASTTNARNTNARIKATTIDSIVSLIPSC